MRYLIRYATASGYHLTEAGTLHADVTKVRPDREGQSMTMPRMLDHEDVHRAERGQRRIPCDCGAPVCAGWAWARPDICPPCLSGRHENHQPVWANSGSWCPCPDCETLTAPD